MNLEESPDTTLAQQLPLLRNEARVRRVPLAMTFVVIALLGLALAALWPRKYESSTTILVLEDNIIQPLMEGRAVPTGVADRARIAREVIFSRKIIDQVLEHGGWLKDDPTPIERERLAIELRRRTTIGSPGANLIEISYADRNPVRALEVARKLGDAFIEETLAAKERESREAYEFIAARTDEYHRKLTEAEERLKQFRASNPDARPGSATDVNTRIAQLRASIEQARSGVAESSVRAGAVASQIADERSVTAAQNRENQYRERLGKLQTELDTLRLSYTDEYPDVIRLKRQIEDLEGEIAASRSGGAELQGAALGYAPSTGSSALRTELTRARGEAAAMRARVSESEALLEAELARANRVADTEAVYAELTRDYEVNRDLYQDLLKRRENARVSMQLDAEHRGLTFRIQEPAALPLQPSGLRFMHLSAAGLAAAIAIPLALLWLVVRFDPRVRSAAQLERAVPVPVLVTVPRYARGPERRRDALRHAVVFGSVALVIAAYAAVGIARLMSIA
ncbi:MAG TPA: XrtA system polysaccharide chain length determinant [Xanthomonadales bacterium]|nr:XrtA system polysaccharide chain length determinant [Xanthomonadales bacterium]